MISEKEREEIEVMNRCFSKGKNREIIESVGDDIVVSSGKARDTFPESYLMTNKLYIKGPLLSSIFPGRQVFYICTPEEAKILQW